MFRSGRFHVKRPTLQKSEGGAPVIFQHVVPLSKEVFLLQSVKGLHCYGGPAFRPRGHSIVTCGFSWLLALLVSRCTLLNHVFGVLLTSLEKVQRLDHLQVPHPKVFVGWVL
jgi:hypothetical protein